MGSDEAGVIILGHGSRRAEANEVLLNLVEKLKQRLGTNLIEGAFFSLAEPDLKDALTELVGMGCRSVLIQPFFLVRGNHIVCDIPDLIKECKSSGCEVEIELLEPLGEDAGLVDIMEERLSGKIGYGAPPEAIPPDGIEKLSMELVERGIQGLRWGQAELPVVKRVVHTTADFSFARTLIISLGAVQAGKDALRRGCNIVVDVEMVKAGISGKLGNRVLCKISDEEVFRMAESGRTTRAWAAMSLLAPQMEGSIVAIGNSPTALERVLDLARDGSIRPALVVGVPVGFVGAARAKHQLAESGMACITNSGPRGGSPVAAAVVNALIYESGKGRESEHGR